MTYPSITSLPQDIRAQFTEQEQELYLAEYNRLLLELQAKAELLQVENITAEAQAGALRLVQLRQ